MTFFSKYPVTYKITFTVVVARTLRRQSRGAEIVSGYLGCGSFFFKSQIFFTKRFAIKKWL